MAPSFPWRAFIFTFGGLSYVSMLGHLSYVNAWLRGTRGPHSAVVVICPSCLAQADTPGSLLGDKVKGQKTAGHPPSVLKPEKINRRNISMAFFIYLFILQFFPVFFSSAVSSANPAEPQFRIGSLRLFLLVCSRLGTGGRRET